MMASSLRRLITSNLVTTRSTFRPTLVSASLFRSIDAGHRSYSTSPKDDFDQSSLTIPCPKFSKMSFIMEMTIEERSLKLMMPNDRLKVKLEKPGLNIKNMRPCTDEHNTWFIQDIKLPDKTSSDINEEVTTLNEDELKTSIILNNMASDIITSFRDLGTKHCLSYYDMFSDRSILGKGLCRLIAMQSLSNSFTIRKKETDYHLLIDMCIPGKEEMKLTKQGLRVSLRLGGDKRWEWREGLPMEREEVTVFFDYDTLFIEGKSKTHHYITGIHLPNDIKLKHNMIKREIEEDGLFHAFIPCCGELEELQDRLKLIQ